MPFFLVVSKFSDPAPGEGAFDLARVEGLDGFATRAEAMQRAGELDLDAQQEEVTVVETEDAQTAIEIVFRDARGLELELDRPDR